jgi:hypothetical protein
VSAAEERKSTVDRDHSGRFTENNPGRKKGTKNKATVTKQELNEAFLSPAPTRFPKVMGRVWDLAERGVEWAVKLVFEYCLGKPIQGIEVSNPLGNVFEVRVHKVDE